MPRKKKKLSRKAAEAGKKATKAPPQAKHESPPAPVEKPNLQPPPSPQRTPEEQEPYNLLTLNTALKVGELFQHYRFPGKVIPHRILEKLETIKTAPNLEEAEKRAKKAEESMFMECLAAWSRGDSPGPDKPENEFTLEQRAKKAESLAKTLKKKGDLDGYKDQMMRAIELREKVKELRKCQS